MGNVQMEADQIRFKNASYGNVQTALTAALAGGGGGSSTLAGLTDTDITTPSNGQILKYDGTSSKWENANLGTPSLADLTDTTISSPENGQVLKYDSSASKWVNGSGGSSGNANVYSADPVIIGTFNGQDLYRKTFFFEGIADTGTPMSAPLPTGALIQNMYGGINGTTVNVHCFMPLVYETGAAGYQIGFYYDYSDSKIHWDSSRGNALAEMPGYIAIEYIIESNNANEAK